MTESQIEEIVRSKFPWIDGITGNEATDLMLRRSDFRHWLIDADKAAAEYRAFSRVREANAFAEVGR